MKTIDRLSVSCDKDRNELKYRVDGEIVFVVRSFLSPEQMENFDRYSEIILWDMFVGEDAITDGKKYAKRVVSKITDNPYELLQELNEELERLRAERKMKKINENTKVTLTFGQLKRLVRESESENEFREFFGVKSRRIHPVGDESFGGTEGRPKTYQNIEIDGVEAGYVERKEASVGGVFAHYLKPDKYADHNVLFVLIVNPLDENGNEIDFDKEVGHDKDLSFPNEEWWEVRFKSEDEMLSAFDTLQRKFKGAVFDFSDEAIERIADWERKNGVG